MAAKCLIVLATIFVGAFCKPAIIQASEIETSLDENADKCFVKECVEIADLILANIDVTVDPCEDFYNFACGKYAVNNPIPESKRSISEDTKINDIVSLQIRDMLEEPIAMDEPEHFKKVKIFYKTCMNTEKIEEDGLSDAKEILKSIGGWPVVEDSNPKATWKDAIYTLANLGFECAYLLRVEVQADVLNSGKRSLELGVPKFELDRDYLIKGKSDRIVAAYYDLMVGMATLFGADEDVAKKDMDDVLQFETKLAESTKSMVEFFQDMSKNYNLYTVRELTEKFPEFPWSDYIGNLTLGRIEVNEDLKVNVVEPKFVEALVVLLKTTPSRIVRNYLALKAVCDMAEYLSQDVLDLAQKFKAAVLGQSKPMERHSECIVKIKERLEALVSALYVRKHFDEHSKAVGVEMTDYIKKTFAEILDQTNWTDEDKVKARAKIENLYASVGYPKELVNDEKLSEVFQEMEVNEKSLLRTALGVNRHIFGYMVGLLNESLDRTNWLQYAMSAEVNAVYAMTFNSIIIPAGILQGVFFNAKRPKYVNFAAIGTVIGHEITHGFDDVGYQFDKDGVLNKWWSSKSEQDFDEKKKCFVNLYDQFITPSGGQVNGSLTVGENLADFGGTKTAYQSYQSWLRNHNAEPGLPGLNYTNNQLFWLSMATTWCISEKPESLDYTLATDTHAPEQYRVNGVVQNLNAFAEDFACPIGSKMNPTTKCKPW